MSPLSYPRLRYLLAGTGLFFLLFVLLRLAFYLGFSEISIIGTEAAETDAVLTTLGIGARFDLRLAILLMLPPALLLILPCWNARWRRWVLRVWLLAALLATGLVYIVDFGHYAWLGVRVDASVWRFFSDFRISAQLVWENYPVLPILALWLLSGAGYGALFLGLERWTLDHPALATRWWKQCAVVTLTVIAALLGMLGRVSNINPENPVPLRWSDAFYSGNTRIGALGLNPVIFIWDTRRIAADNYDLAFVREHADAVATYLGASEVLDRDRLPRFERLVPPQKHRLTFTQPPNVIFIMLESLGGSRTGLHGNPLKPTPCLDDLARTGWFLRNFYVPRTGTAKTVWASLTGIPDVSRTGSSASRNPLLLPQQSVLNEFAGYDKHYAIGGSAGWANINALIQSSIKGMRLHEEGEWKSPNIDVWGISDLALFREMDAFLRDLPRDRPFFAIIQTADNHPPFTIPADNDGFVLETLPEEVVRQAGFISNAQYNAVRMLDHSLKRFFEMAKKSGYYDNTIFVLYGDHGGRVSQLPFRPKVYEELDLAGLHVPGIIHAPRLMRPRVIEEATSLIDLLPTIAGLLGLEYRNTTMGRDIQMPAPEGERAVPVLWGEGNFPRIGVVTRRHAMLMTSNGAEPGLYAVNADRVEDISEQEPAEFMRLSRLARELHEAARVMLYSNRAEPDRKK